MDGTETQEQVIAFVGLDTARFMGWLPEYKNAVLVVRDSMGLKLDRPLLEIPAENDKGGTLELLSHPETLSFLRHHGVHLLVVFKPSFRVQQWAENHGMTLVSGDCSLGQRIENKAKFSEMADEFGLTVPRHLVFSGTSIKWSEATESLGPRVVLQKARGHSGQGTYFVSRKDEWDAALRGSNPRSSWKVSSFLEGETWTFNGVLWADGNVMLGGFYRQRTGDSLCTPNSLGACGNVWIGHGLDHRFESAQRTLVDFLRKQGFVGPFGADLLVPSGDAPLVVLEINSRATSGLSMESLLTRGSGQRPMLASIVDACQGINQQSSMVFPQMEAVQAVLYSDETESFQMGVSIRSGTYEMGGRGVKWVREDVDPTHCRESECVVLARSRSQWIGAQGETLRLQTLGSEDTLRPWIKWAREQLSP